MFCQWVFCGFSAWRFLSLSFFGQNIVDIPEKGGIITTGRCCSNSILPAANPQTVAKNRSTIVAYSQKCEPVFSADGSLSLSLGLDVETDCYEQSADTAKIPNKFENVYIGHPLWKRFPREAAILTLLSAFAGRRATVCHRMPSTKGAKLDVNGTDLRLYYSIFFASFQEQSHLRAAEAPPSLLPERKRGFRILF